MTEGLVFEEAGYSAPFNFDEAINNRGVLIIGGPRSGKTNLGYHLVDQLDRKKPIVWRCFDGAKSWYNSNLPYYQVVKVVSRMDREVKASDLPSVETIFDFAVPMDKSILYDINELLPSEQILFVSGVLSGDWEMASEYVLPYQIGYVFEECALYLNSFILRSKLGQLIRRTLKSGKNIGIAKPTIFIDQFASEISTTAIRLCNQMFLGQNHEENEMRKLQNWVGKEEIKALFDLKVGEFIYWSGGRIHTAKIPLFKQKARPEQWVTTEEIELNKKEERKSIFDRLRRVEEKSDRKIPYPKRGGT